MTSGWWHRAVNAGLFNFLMILAGQAVVAAQQRLPARHLMDSDVGALVQVCDETIAPTAAKDALRLLCLRRSALTDEVTVGRAIVVGFVGGFVNHDDVRRPEVQFATFLRQRYPSAVRVEVFANRDGRAALRWLLRQLDTDDDDKFAAAESEQTAIIIYGHSWGGSQAVTLARHLERLGIRVRLTIQVDSVMKPWQSDWRIPPNVDRAINFYQSEGLLLHGRPTIKAADPDRTSILGNFRRSYKGNSISCDNYPWLVRVLSRPHHEIENDPVVWNNAGFLIDSELSSRQSAPQGSWRSGTRPTNGRAF